MQSDQTLAGIDVSARTLAGRRLREGKEEAKAFTNDRAGHREVIRWVGKGGRVCVEATGVYHLALALALRAAGVEVMVVNPRVAKDFARALANRSKTDEVDAGVLLEYARRMDFLPWEAPSEAVLELRELGRRLGQLVQMAKDEKNRLHARNVSNVSRRVVANVREHIARLEKDIKAVEKLAVEVIISNADLHEQFDLVRKARSFGRRSAVLLLTELAVLDPTMTVRQLVAYAGLDPRVYESGTSVQKPPRISKLGNARLRAILFMNALSAVRHDRGARLFFTQLLARGKKKMQAIVAVMRKLLHGIWTVLQRREPFDSEILFAASLAKAESTDSAVAASQPESDEDHPKGRSEAEELRQQLEPGSTEATPRRKRTKAA